MQLHNNIEDYTLDERLELEHAYQLLEPVAQAGNLTIDETRIRVAYVRLQREENFKISQAPFKKEKVVKEPKEPKIPGTRAKRITKEKPSDDIAKASALFYKQFKGEQLTQEELDFLESKVIMPPPAI